MRSMLRVAEEVAGMAPAKAAWSPCPRAVAGDVAQLEELATPMAPAQRLDDQSKLAVGKTEAVIAVGLQNAGVARQVPVGMLEQAVAQG
jgi:hypothetical protein